MSEGKAKAEGQQQDSDGRPVGKYSRYGGNPQPSKERKGRPMMTYTGRLVYPLDLRPEDIDLQDIIHHLATINRYNGAADPSFSVAMHTLLGLYECLKRYPDHPLTALKWLLHDAPEAYLMDIPRPLKDGDIGDLGTGEAAIFDVLCTRFGINTPIMTPSIVELDNDILATEFRHVMHSVPDTVPGTYQQHLQHPLEILAGLPHTTIKSRLEDAFNAVYTCYHGAEVDCSEIAEMVVGY